jgi:hypothetical protein
MSSRRVFLYVIVSLIVVAVLVGGGYAIYRLGYVHGTQGTSSLNFDKRLLPNFDRSFAPDFMHRRGYIGFPFMGVIPGLFFGLVSLMIIALAVYGGIKLLWPGSRKMTQISESQPPESKDPIEEPPSKD